MDANWSYWKFQRETEKNVLENILTLKLSRASRRTFTSMIVWSRLNQALMLNVLYESLELGGFLLTKWVSNRKEVLAIIPKKERAASVVDIDCEQQPLERTLGIQWNVESDEFGFKIMKKEKPSTRRRILSIVSSVYDPLGFVAPFILTAKMILQGLCRKTIGWDD